MTQAEKIIFFDKCQYDRRKQLSVHKFFVQNFLLSHFQFLHSKHQHLKRQPTKKAV